MITADQSTAARDAVHTAKATLGIVGRCTPFQLKAVRLRAAQYLNRVGTPSPTGRRWTICSIGAACAENRSAV